MNKIFISHSKFDMELAHALVRFLEIGIGIPESTIFCSSVSGHDIPLGVNFNDYIIDQLKGNDAEVLSIISNSYYNSKYCLYELGAAWGICQQPIIPILVHEMKFGNLSDFISFNQAVDASDVLHLNKLAEHFRDSGRYELKKVTHTNYEKERNLLLKALKKSMPRSKPKSSEFNKSTFKYKGVVFDFDGTILQGKGFKYSWKEVWRYLNHDDEIRKQLFKKHLNDPENYSYQDWCDECAQHFIARNLTRDKIVDIIDKRNLKLAEGFEMTIKLLNEFGIRTAIISGGIDTFIEETVPDQTLELIDKVWANKFTYNPKGELAKIVAYQNRESDSTGKVKALHDFCSKINCKPEHIVFVGEGTNDIDVSGQAGLALSYPARNASPQYNSLNYVLPIYYDNISSILPYVLKLE